MVGNFNIGLIFLGGRCIIKAYFVFVVVVFILKRIIKGINSCLVQYLISVMLTGVKNYQTEPLIYIYCDLASRS